jgi:hypothetical protein
VITKEAAKMAAPVRRFRIALSSRPWLYWTGVAVLAAVTGLSTQAASKPNPTSCAAVSAGSAADPLARSMRGIAVPLGEPALPVHVGDRVDVVGVARNLSVLAVTDIAAVVAIPDENLDEVVAAVRARTTVLALVQRSA